MHAKTGHFIEEDPIKKGVFIFKVGKYKGIDVESVYEDDEGYIDWVYRTTEDLFDLDVLNGII